MPGLPRVRLSGSPLPSSLRSRLRPPRPRPRLSRPHLFAGMPREVPALLAVAFAVAVGFGIVAPVIPVFARRFGVSRTAAGAVVSAFAFTRLLSALVAGRLADRFGERLVLATGVGVVAVSSAFAGASQSYVQLLVLRGVGGFGSALFIVSATSLLLRVVEPARRGRASGLLSGAFLAGGIAGPAFGGPIAAISLRLPFYLYAGTLAVAGAVAVLALREPRAGPGEVREQVSRGPSLSLAGAFRDPAYRAAVLASVGDAWASVGVRSAIVPLFVVDVLHRGSGWTYAGFVIVAVVNVAVLLPAARWADDRGRRPVLVVGCALTGASMALLALPFGLGGYLTSMVVLGVGSALLDVAPAAVVGDVIQGADTGPGAAPRRGGRVVAGYQMSGDVGSVGGPVVSGRLADRVSYGAAFGVTAAVLAAATAVALAAPETRGRGVSAQPQPDVPHEPSSVG